MKTNTIFIFIMFITLIISCTKEKFEVTSSNESYNILGCDLKVIDNMLVFNTPEEFQNLINSLDSMGYDYYENWGDAICFKSLRSYYEESYSIDDLLIKDELFASLLNPDYKIQIGKYIFHLDPKNKIVNVLGKEGDLKSLEKTTFTFGDEVLPYLFGGGELKSTTTCSSGKGYDINAGPVYWDCWSDQIKCDVYYNASGIYFSIYIDMRLQNCIFAGVEMMVTTGDNSSIHYDNCNGYVSGEYGRTKIGCKIRQKVYGGIKKVNDCYLPVYYSATSADNACNDEKYLVLEF